MVDCRVDQNAMPPYNYLKPPSASVLGPSHLCMLTEVCPCHRPQAAAASASKHNLPSLHIHADVLCDCSVAEGPGWAVPLAIAAAWGYFAWALGGPFLEVWLFSRKDAQQIEDAVAVREALQVPALLHVWFCQNECLLQCLAAWAACASRCASEPHLCFGCY